MDPNQMLNGMLRMQFMQFMQNTQLQQQQQQQQQITNRMLEMQMEMNKQMLKVLVSKEAASLPAANMMQAILPAPPSQTVRVTPINDVEIARVQVDQGSNSQANMQAIMPAPLSQTVQVTPMNDVEIARVQVDQGSNSQANEPSDENDERTEKSASDLAAEAALKRKADASTHCPLTRSMSLKKFKE